MQLQRHQLMHKLLHEQPHLRIQSGEFREMFVIRSVYVVGPDIRTLSDYTGYNKRFIEAVRNKYNAEMVKAYRAYVNGSDYEKTVVESLKEVVRTVVRAVEKRTLKRKFADLARKFNFKRRAGARA